MLTPWSNRVGVSRRIDSDKERRRLREIVERLRPRELGFIIRTAGDGVREADLEADIRYLADVWEQIKSSEPKPAPCVLYSEPDLTLRVIRDFANPETTRIAIDSEVMHARLTDFVDRFVADPREPDSDLHRGRQRDRNAAADRGLFQASDVVERNPLPVG